ncbi:trypsin beta-like, partial [Copidosoma floridanum]|uniref:trypsin beta-like n=1 Tax=Copidosoma floridanum TaxID=29053 RepID=UPI0006C99D19
MYVLKKLATSQILWLLTSTAILKVHGEFNVFFDDRLSSVGLPLDNVPYENAEANVTGLGMHELFSILGTSGLSKTTGRIRYLVTDVLSQSECKSHFVLLEDTILCAKTKFRPSIHGPEGVCRMYVMLKGDSGGPLVHNGILIGIQSFGPTDCDETYAPSYYIKV